MDSIFLSKGLNRAIFTKVFGWSLIAYVVIGAILSFVFIKDSLPARDLVIIVVMLLVFAADIPFNIAFTVAKYTS